MENSNVVTAKTNKSSKGNLPNSEIELLAIARIVSNNWLANTKYTMDWITATAFKEIVDQYENLLDTRTTAGHLQTSTVNNMDNINQRLNEHLEFLKNMIREEYGNNDAVAYFAEFGIIHDKKGYHLPNDGNSRLTSLQYLLRALTARNWTTQKYGLNFWTPLVEEYNTLFSVSTNTKGTISVAVQNKKKLNKDIKKVLNAIIHLLRANYPDTFKGVLRDWGFQKEKY